MNQPSKHERGAKICSHYIQTAQANQETRTKAGAYLSSKTCKRSVKPRLLSKLEGTGFTLVTSAWPIPHS
eukprot:343042-Pelagomonas_calceolata.AAC.1